MLCKRQNVTEEVIANIIGGSQGAISAIITEFSPLIARATEKFRPDVEEAKQTARGRLALVDGPLWSCWSCRSWESAPGMRAGKYKTAGHGSLIISDESGNIIFVSRPAPGCDHDMKKPEGEVKEILGLAGAVIAGKGFQGSGYRELYMSLLPGQAEPRGDGLGIGTSHDPLIEGGAVKPDSHSAGRVVMDRGEQPAGRSQDRADLDHAGNPGSDLRPRANPRLPVRVIDHLHGTDR
jgi:hypothetical protein